MAVDIRAQFLLLKDLQHIDLALYRLTQDIASLPREIAELEQEYVTLKAVFEGVTKELADIEHVRRQDEGDLAVTVEDLRRREARLYALKTNKEYQAALKEMADAKKQNREREDRILQAMEKSEMLMKKKTQLAGEFADKEAKFKEQSQFLAEREKVFRHHMEEVGARRPEVMAQIDVKILRQYDFIRRRYADAVAAVSRGVCSGCHMNVPPQLYNEILRFQEIKSGPSCHRLIYADETAGSLKEERL